MKKLPMTATRRESATDSPIGEAAVAKKFDQELMLGSVIRHLSADIDLCAKKLRQASGPSAQLARNQLEMLKTLQSDLAGLLEEICSMNDVAWFAHQRQLEARLAFLLADLSGLSKARMQYVKALCRQAIAS